MENVSLLAEETQCAIIVQKLHPVIRVFFFYHQFAFQIPEGACIRISLDT
jgi:SPX domain protein involved in polyphosphate accumulation